MSAIAEWVAARAVPLLAGARYRVGAGELALTFDDGPDPVFTPQVLDALAAAGGGASATFFVVGRHAAEHPALVRRIVDEGHAIGSHSDTHARLDELSGDAVAAELRAGRAAVEALAGTPVTLFRPPRGHLDRRGAVAMRRAGLRPWLWTVDPQDWRPGSTTSAIVDAVGRAAGGDVVLLHDRVAGDDSPSGAEDRSATVAAVPLIVEAARARGLTLVTLPT